MAHAIARLVGALLRHSCPRHGFMALISRGIKGGRDGYAVAVRKIVRLSVLSIVLIVAFGRRYAGGKHRRNLCDPYALRRI